MKIFKFISDNAEVIVALFALFVSGVSIWFTRKAMEMQRIHNRNSVKPLALISPGDYEDDLFVKIENFGLGPLIIKELRFHSGGLSADSLIDLLPNDIRNSVTWKTYVGNSAGRVIATGRDIFLLRLTIEHSDIERAKKEKIKTPLRKFLSTVKIVLEYTDVYDEEVHIVTKELTWFKQSFG